MSTSHEFGHPAPLPVQSGEAIHAPGQGVGIVNSPEAGVFALVEAGEGSAEQIRESIGVVTQMIDTLPAGDVSWTASPDEVQYWTKNVLEGTSSLITGGEELGRCTPAIASVIRIVDGQNGEKIATWSAVGDIRIYHVSGDTVQQITTDEGDNHQELTNWLGDQSQGVKYTDRISCKPGDRLIIANNAVTGDAGSGGSTPEQLKQIVDGLEAEAAAQALVGNARKKDDQAALVIDIPLASGLESEPAPFIPPEPEQAANAGLTETQIVRVVGAAVPAVLQSIGFVPPSLASRRHSEDDGPQGDGRARAVRNLTHEESVREAAELKVAGKALIASIEARRVEKAQRPLAELPNSRDAYRADMDRLKNAVQALKDANVPTVAVDVLQRARGFRTFSLQEYTGDKFSITSTDGTAKYRKKETVRAWLIPTPTDFHTDPTRHYYVFTQDGRTYETSSRFVGGGSKFGNRHAVIGAGSLFADELARIVRLDEQNNTRMYTGTGYTKQSPIVRKIQNAIAALERL